MSKKIFVNLPVADLPRSLAFYQALGYENNKQFTDETAACIVISEHIYVMLLTHGKFKDFTPNAICDAKTATEVLNALSCDNREQVGELVQKAIAAGGSTYGPPQDHGFMLQHGFQDPDGHIWEIFYMDPNFVQPQ